VDDELEGEMLENKLKSLQKNPDLEIRVKKGSCIQVLFQETHLVRARFSDRQVMRMLHYFLPLKRKQFTSSCNVETQIKLTRPRII